MKTISLLGTLFFAVGITLFAQPKGETPLIMFKNDTVMLSEFERVYKKNNDAEMLNKSTIDEYLDLYINFRRKVMEAQAMGLDTLKSFRREFKGYRDQLAQPYFTIDEVKEKLEKEAYERMQTEVRAQHILIRSSSTDTPEDTLKAYKKILDIRKQALKGASFDDLAIKYSEDGSVKDNKGDLGYFTAFQMVYPFENAAYETEVGEISKPVKTQFGYHILKVNDKIPARGKVRVSQILISKPKKNDENKVVDAEQKVHEIYDKIVKEGADFAEMARKYSDDFRSAQRGGELEPFGVGRMILEFEKEAFDLNEKGDISEPFQTSYGWHIIKLEEKIPVGNYESMEKMISESVRKDARSLLTEDAILAKIKNEYNFTESPNRKKDFYKLLDSTYFKSNWEIPKNKNLSRSMFVIGDKEYTQKDFANYLKSVMHNRSPISFEVLVNNEYEKFKKKSLKDYKDSQLEVEYPEFAALVKEYHDGILLFNLTDEMVWTKAVKDSVGLAEFYEDRKENYMWDERAKANLYILQDEKTAKKAKKMVSKRASKGYSNEDILNEINEDSQLKLKIEEDVFSKGENEFVDKFWKVGISDFYKKDNEIIFVEVEELQAPRPRTIMESRGQITSDYQEYLENEWLKNLEEKYPVQINDEALKKLKAEYN